MYKLYVIPDVQTTVDALQRKISTTHLEIKLSKRRGKTQLNMITGKYIKKQNVINTTALPLFALNCDNANTKRVINMSKKTYQTRPDVYNQSAEREYRSPSA